MFALRTFMAALAALSTGAIAQPETVLPDDETLVDEAALARDGYERMTVLVTIEGAGPYRFLIDTGAQSTVVTQELVEDLALRKSGGALLVAMGSSKRVETVELDGLEFANRSISGLVSPLLDARHVGADGILGLDSLQDLRVLIDFRKERILVADAAELGGNSGYEIIVRARKKLGQMVITDAEVSGIRTAVIIDTGAHNTIANTALMKKLRMRNHAKLLSTDVLGTELTSDLVFLPEMKIGGMQLTDMPVGIADSPVFDALGLADRPAIILGLGNLRVFDRVAIDFAKKRVLFDVPKDVRRGSASDWIPRL